MHGTIGRALALGAMLAAAAACGSSRGVNDVLAERRSADAREYKVEPDAAWRLVRQTFEQAGFAGIEERRGESAVVAERTVTGESSSTLAAGWIEPLKDGMTRVSFATIRGSSVAPRSPVSESELHVRFAGLVGLEGR